MAGLNPKESGGVIELVDTQVEGALRRLPYEVVRRAGVHDADVVRLAQPRDHTVGSRVGPEPRDAHVRA